MTLTQQQPLVVAVDLGSNSFHLLEATLDQRGNLKPLRVLARKVQLALEMVGDCMTEAAIARGVACLREFAPYCRHLPAARVRVVGTQALRKASNQQVFLSAAQELLRQPVEIISGEEEARLAFLGVAADSDVPDDLFVIDVGGGSTELVTGRGGSICEAASLQLGCVSWLSFFPGGRITPPAYLAAKEAARQIFDTCAVKFSGDWNVVGCSGTLLAVAEVLKQEGLKQEGLTQNDGGRGAITRAGLEALEQKLLSFDHIEAVQFQGLMEHRRNIFASGVAIVVALFESLNLPPMAVSNYGLREGVAWSLLHT